MAAVVGLMTVYLNAAIVDMVTVTVYLMIPAVEMKRATVYLVTAVVH
jgi:hypothetical protein